MKTNTERQSDFKKRMRENGFTQITVWVKPSIIKKLKTYIAKHNKSVA